MIYNNSLKLVGDESAEETIIEDGSTYTVTYSRKLEHWRLNGITHRANGPARLSAITGTQSWFNEGKLHRTNGPAIVRTENSEEWYQNGLRHRTDGPAVTDSTGMKWLQNDKLHRTNGPAVERTNGAQEWFINGKRHRTDGPAIIQKHKQVEWFVNGRQVFLEEYTEIIENMFIKQACESDTTIVNIKDFPLSEMKSFLYSMNGWEKNTKKLPYQIRNSKHPLW
jgi:hypothetical protein